VCPFYHNFAPRGTGKWWKRRQGKEKSPPNGGLLKLFFAGAALLFCRKTERADALAQREIFAVGIGGKPCARQVQLALVIKQGIVCVDRHDIGKKEVVRAHRLYLGHATAKRNGRFCDQGARDLVCGNLGEIAFFDERQYIEDLYNILKYPILKLEEANRNNKDLLDNLAQVLTSNYKSLIINNKNCFEDMLDRLGLLIDKKFGDYTNLLDKLSIRISSANPIEIMKRGFTQTKNSKGLILSSVSDYKIGEEIETLFADGSIYSEIKTIKEKDNE
jgi:hypothetical protein